MTFTQDERAALAKAREIRRRASKKAKRARPVNPKKDRGRVREPAFLAFLRRQPCSVRQLSGLGCEGPIQAAHIRSHKPGELPTGMGRKPDDRRCTSLCAKHHAEQHATNELRWWARYGLDPFAVAEALYARFLAAVPQKQGAEG